MRNGEKSNLIGEDFDLSGSRIRQLAKKGEELKHKRDIDKIKNTLPEKTWVKANTPFLPK